MQWNFGFRSGDEDWDWEVNVNGMEGLGALTNKKIGEDDDHEKDDDGDDGNDDGEDNDFDDDGNDDDNEEMWMSMRWKV